jgi:hypothetical protein
MYMPKGNTLELKAMLKSLRAPVHTAGAPAPAPAPALDPAPSAPVQVCYAHTSPYPYTLFSLPRTYAHLGPELGQHFRQRHRQCSMFDVYLHVCMNVYIVCVYIV